MDLGTWVQNLQVGFCNFLAWMQQLQSWIQVQGLGVTVQDLDPRVWGFQSSGSGVMVSQLEV